MWTSPDAPAVCSSSVPSGDIPVPRGPSGSRTRSTRPCCRSADRRSRSAGVPLSVMPAAWSCFLRCACASLARSTLPVKIRRSSAYRSSGVSGWCLHPGSVEEVIEVEVQQERRETAPLPEPLPLLVLDCDPDQVSHLPRLESVLDDVQEPAMWHVVEGVTRCRPRPRSTGSCCRPRTRPWPARAPYRASGGNQSWLPRSRDR